mmetsp:Transcript_43851/g.110563  ORF Transcript_43851/g.110563 Transcript_43851/m.110563 type:complete len:83 (+) Transcript_43851:299-547(+)
MRSVRAAPRRCGFVCALRFARACDMICPEGHHGMPPLCVQPPPHTLHITDASHTKQTHKSPTPTHSHCHAPTQFSQCECVSA